MSLRPVTLLFVMLSAFWLTVAAPLQAAAETFLVVINAGNRISASDAELREVVRQLYLKEESRWPDDLPSLIIARPADHAATAAFTETILGVSPEELTAYWAEAGTKPPGAIGPVRDLLRQISRNKGAFSIVAAAEAEKLPAKVRVLFEFATEAPAGDAVASFNGKWVLETRESSQPLGEVERQIVEIVDNKLFAEVSPGIWRGTFVGEIDTTGQLVGHVRLSQISSSASKNAIFKISAPFTDGAFEATAQSRGTSTYTYFIEIKLTPEHLVTAVPLPGDTAPIEPETVALAPSTEAAPGQAGSFDGEWIGSDGPWTAKIQISGRSFDLQANCAGDRVGGGSAAGTLDEDGHIYAILGSGSFRRTIISGVWPKLRFHSDQTSCRGVLDFERVEATGAGAAVSSGGAFDGKWVLELEEWNWRPEEIRTQTTMVNSEFSVSFEGRRWRGQMSGIIDSAGLLVASGYILSNPGGRIYRLNLTTESSDGSYRMEFIPDKASSFATPKFNITLTPEISGAS